ncbi:hypothetical protein REPUB_Repub01dG0075300 [Reevesia pubescens]
MRLNIPAGTAARFEVVQFNLHLLRRIAILPQDLYAIIDAGRGINDIEEPGECKTIVLVSIGGRKVIRGGNGIVDGPVDDANIEMLMETIRIEGYGNLEDANASEGVTEKDSKFSTTISSEAYANMYGPTTGDKIPLGGHPPTESLDIVITNAVIIDYTLVNMEVIDGEGLIVTAEAIDHHVHFICPQLVHEAISSDLWNV